MTQPGFPPYSYPPPPVPGAPPRRGIGRRLLPLWILLGVLFVGLASCMVAVGLAAGHNVGLSGNHPEDVRVDSCTVSGPGSLAATITVTNPTDRTVMYTVEVAFNAPDGAQVATGPAFVGRLGAGLAAREQVRSFTTQPGVGQVGCRVLSADRTVVP